MHNVTAYEKNELIRCGVRSRRIPFIAILRFFFQLTTDKCKSLLVQAICNILMKCKDDRYRIVYILDQRKTTNTLSPLPPVSNPEESATTAEDALSAAESLDTGATSHSDFELEWSPDEFHERLSIHNFESIDDVEKYYSENYHVLSGNYGVLLFMYAVLMTKVGFVVCVPVNFVFVLIVVSNLFAEIYEYYCGAFGHIGTIDSQHIRLRFTRSNQFDANGSSSATRLGP